MEGRRGRERVGDKKEDSVHNMFMRDGVKAIQFGD